MVGPSEAEVAVEGLRRARTHIDHALATTLAQDPEDLLVEVDIVRLGVVGKGGVVSVTVGCRRSGRRPRSGSATNSRPSR
jgi:hypothetical protein